MILGHCSGKGWRDTVITRHPAAEKRFTVAWPIPREAPVSSSTRRGPFGLLRLSIMALQLRPLANDKAL
jgi:hypothetical protein